MNSSNIANFLESAAGVSDSHGGSNPLELFCAIPNRQSNLQQVLLEMGSLSSNGIVLSDLLPTWKPASLSFRMIHQ